MKVQSYKDLEVWKKGIDIVEKAYRATTHFPNEEKYVIAAQIQRAAISIPANIAEGFARQYRKEYVQFLHVALGSCAELETHLIISNRRGYLITSDLNVLQEALDHECRMLMNLIKRLRSS